VPTKVDLPDEGEFLNDGHGQMMGSALRKWMGCPGKGFAWSGEWSDEVELPGEGAWPGERE
jgi:hypothetical protein